MSIEQKPEVPWAEERRGKMSAELNFWRVRKSWLHTELDKVDQKITEITYDIRDDMEKSLSEPRTDSPWDYQPKPESLRESIVRRIRTAINL